MVKGDFYMKISEKIYRLRTENNMTQVQFGKIAGATDKAVSTWERGEKEPRMKSLQRVCAYFGIDINQFADTETDIYKPTPISESGLISPERQALLDAIKDMDEDTVRAVLDVVKSVKKLRGE